MDKKLQQLKMYLAEITDLNGAAALLGWDQQVNIPPEGAAARGEQLGTLGRIAHDRGTSPELGKLLDELKPYAAGLDPDSDEARLIKVAARDYDKAIRVPSDFIVEASQVQSLAYQAWVAGTPEIRFLPLPPAPGEGHRTGPTLCHIFPARRSPL